MLDVTIIDITMNFQTQLQIPCTAETISRALNFGFMEMHEMAHFSEHDGTRSPAEQLAHDEVTISMEYEGWNNTVPFDITDNILTS